jgi:aryl-alcohol dehydrogenase-like predicted oxidoreductase
MRYRTFGRPGLRVSTVSLGGNRLGDPGVLERVEGLRFLERPGQILAQAALRFVLAPPAVHCAAPGARTIEQLEANCAAADEALRPEELARVRELHAHRRAEGRW